jgi:hypothetical protein
MASMLSPRKRCHTDRRCAPIRGFGQSTATSSAPVPLPTPSGLNSLPGDGFGSGGTAGGTEFSPPHNSTQGRSGTGSGGGGSILALNDSARASGK